MDFYNLSSAKSSRSSLLSLNKVDRSHSKLEVQDCTVYSRVGFRGVGAEAFLESNGLPIPKLPNQSLSYKNGLIILRLSKSEFWVVDTANKHHALIEALELSSKEAINVYRLYCQHSHGCFLITGDADLTVKMFSKVCSVDLSQGVFALGSIAQTSVARTNAIVTKQSMDGVVFTLLLADVASTQYLWEAIEDAASEFV
ncbi:sarcosine oxidase subunit gamma [Marinomonas sp. 15G1-11]|mgnify:CR=1 FL=1|uniref:Sarcosine oxidase subunit gamma n=1 Tax=Marinomonas phaeophyticola TaxID=3004091 RepID=A0ABT4JP21_9GAMM|nr:sarcosine oxidase subunit gamma [Marinomonas sp. 15G1-11]MCZ2720114.1 sarcosine oxidase subunit gamma [Marinomonas sp. 15G1-11]